MDGLTLRDYIKVLFRQKWMIFMCIITVTLTVDVGLKLQTKHYAARVKLLISAQKQSESPYYHDIVGFQNTELALTESEIVTSTPVLDRALKAILTYKPLSGFVEYERPFASELKQKLIDYQVKKFNKYMEGLKLTDAQMQSYLYRMAMDDLRRNVKVDPIQDTNIFTITVTDYDPYAAAVMANIISRSYIIFDLEQQLAEMQQKYGEKNLAIFQLRDDIKSMSQNLTGLPLDNVDAIGPASVKIIEQAYPPIQALGQPKIRIMILAFVMSIILGCILAFIFDYMDQTFRSPEEIERTLGLPFLGSVLKRNKLIAFKSVAEHIYLLMKEKKFKTLIFIASRLGEGVSTVSRNVGKYISSVLGHRVLIIEANPKQHRFFKRKKYAPVVCGLFEMLEDKSDFDHCVQKTEDKLHFLPVGHATSNPFILLGSSKMTEFLKEARLKYEVILIDTDSLHTSLDALELSNEVEAVVLVVAEGITRRHAVKSALEDFKGRKANVLGAILNKRKYPLPGFVYQSV